MNPRLYPILDAPLPLDLKGMGKREANAYLRWFLENRDRRIEILLAHLGIRDADSSSEIEPALRQAGLWLVDHGSYEPLDSAFVENRRSQVGPRLAFTVSDRELSHETLAFCYDMGALLGKLFKQRLPDFEYTVRLGGKRNIDYGHIVLAKPGKVDLNPYQLCTIIAYKAMSGMLKDHEIQRMIQANLEIRP